MGGLETLLPLLSAGGVYGILLGVIIYLLRNGILDRRDYREDTEKSDKRYDDLLAKNRDLQTRLDQERALRREKEDEAARSTIAIERMNYEMSALREEVKALRKQVAGLNGS